MKNSRKPHDTFVITRGQVIDKNRILPSANVVIVDGKIDSVCEEAVDIPHSVTIDAQGHYVAPGFIDIHVHGGGGYDFMDNSLEAFSGIARAHARFGTTSMFPTTLASDKNQLTEAIKCYEATQTQALAGAQFLGLHLEGPYFAMSQKGAQDPRFIRPPNPTEYQAILSQYPCIKRWSAAPELEGAMEFGKYLREKRVLPAVAHSEATYEDMVKAFDAGYCLVTHMYSSMSSVTRKNGYRTAGIVESALLMDELDIEVIADGKHLPAPLLQLLYKIKGPDRIALVTDAMRGAGMPEGESILGNIDTGLKVIVEDGVAKLPDRSAFAGSVATTNHLVRNMVRLAGVSICDAVKMLTATPARIMGVLDRKGTLEPGKDADVVLFDDDFNVLTVIIAGKVFFQSGGVTHGKAI